MRDTAWTIFGRGCFLIMVAAGVLLLGAVAWTLVGGVVVAVVANPGSVILPFLITSAWFGVVVGATALFFLLTSERVKQSRWMRWITGHRRGLMQVWFLFWVLPLDYAVLSVFGLETQIIPRDLRAIVVSASAALFHYMIRKDNVHAVALGVLLLVAMFMRPDTLGSGASAELWMIASVAIVLSTLALTLWHPWEDAAKELIVTTYGVWPAPDVEGMHRLIVGELVLRTLGDGEWHTAGELYNRAGLPGHHLEWSEKQSRVRWWLLELSKRGDLQGEPPLTARPSWEEVSSDRRWRLADDVGSREHILGRVLQDGM